MMAIYVIAKSEYLLVETDHQKINFNSDSKARSTETL